MSISSFSMSCSTSCAQEFFCALQRCSASGAAGGAGEWNSPGHAQDVLGHGPSARVLSACHMADVPERLEASPCSLTSSAARRLLVDIVGISQICFCPLAYIRRSIPKICVLAVAAVGVAWRWRTDVIEPMCETCGLASSVRRLPLAALAPRGVLHVPGHVFGIR